MIMPNPSLRFMYTNGGLRARIIEYIDCFPDRERFIYGKDVFVRLLFYVLKFNAVTQYREARI